MYTSGAYLVLSIILSLLISFVLAYLAYKSKTFKTSSKLLFGLRWIALTLLMLILFNPGIKITKITDQKPLLYFLEDNTSSIKYLTDSAELNTLNNSLNSIKIDLETYYDIETFYFDNSVYGTVDERYKGPVTDIGNTLKKISELDDKTVNKVVLVSDGNYNQGENPLFLSAGLPYELYTVSIGDTISENSFYFRNLYHNMVGYTNEEIPIEANIRYEKLTEDTVINVEVLSDDKVIKTDNINLDSRTRRTKYSSYFKYNKIGLKKFTIRIKDVPTSARSFYLEVKKQKQKVLVLYHSVHPDIGVIRRALDLSNRFDPVIVQANQFDQEISDFNLIVFHQIPSGQFAEDRWFAEAVTAQIPKWVILGPKSDISTFNQGQDALQLNNFNGQYDEAGIYLNDNFSWFKSELNQDFNSASWPPLTVPFANYKVKKGVSLFDQSLMGIETERPAWLFVDQPYRYSILTGTGLWKWGIYDYRMNGNHNKIHDLVYKTVRYLSLNKPKKRLQLNVAKVYESSQSIEFEAIWYNQNYEIDNTLPGNMVLIDSTNKEFDFAFIPSGNKYKIQAGLLSPGLYKYKAKISSENELFSNEGSFVVSETNLEKNDYKANIQLLRKLSGSKNSLYFKEVDNLREMLKPDEKHQIIQKTDTKIADLIDDKLFLFLIITLFALEWTIRKYRGQL